MKLDRYAQGAYDLSVLLGSGVLDEEQYNRKIKKLFFDWAMECLEVNGRPLTEIPKQP